MFQVSPFCNSTLSLSQMTSGAGWPTNLPASSKLWPHTMWIFSGAKSSMKGGSSRSMREEVVEVVGMRSAEAGLGEVEAGAG